MTVFSAKRSVKPVRQQVVAQLQAPTPLWKRSLLRRGGENDKGGPAGNGQDADEEGREECKDIIQELSLSVEPIVEELGDETILAMKKAGTLEVEDDEVLALFRKHKAMKGKLLFEAENANNIGVEHFGYGDIPFARTFFEKALEMINRPQKTAAQELSDLHEFILAKYNGERTNLYDALAAGEFKLSLSRRRFVEIMKNLGYPGDADRLYTIANTNGKNDGKVTTVELDRVIKAQPLRLDEMDREPVEKGIVLSNIAACDMQQNNAGEALHKLREAGKIIQYAAERGDGDLRVQRVMGNVASAYILLGAHDCALNYLSASLTQREAVQSSHDPDILNVLYLIGYCFLVKANRFDIVFDRKRMDSRQQENPVEVNYSLALCAFKDRLRRQQAAMEASMQDFPGGSDQLRLDIARSHEVIAEIHDQRGELERAMKHLELAVKQKEEMLAEGDPDLLNSWNVYASVAVEAGLFEEAINVLEKAYTASVALFGENSLSVATEQFYMALVNFRIGIHLAKGDREQAEASFKIAVTNLQRVISVRTEYCGEESPEVCECHQLMGNILLAIGDRKGARRSFQRALLLRTKVMGTTHVAVASSCHALGCFYARTPRRHQEAIFLLRKAVRIREKRLEEDSLHLAESLHELGSALLRRHAAGDTEAALPLLSRAAQIREKKAGRRSLSYAASMQQVGQAHLQLELYSEARLYFQAALSIREQLAGKKAIQTAMTHFALGLTFYNLGDFNLAMKQLKLSYSAREAFFGPEHPHSADSLHLIGMVYVKKGDMNASLPFLLRSLDIRIKLNEEECQERLEDSDEDEATRRAHQVRVNNMKPEMSIAVSLRPPPPPPPVQQKMPGKKGSKRNLSKAELEEVKREARDGKQSPSIITSMTRAFGSIKPNGISGDGLPGMETRSTFSSRISPVPQNNAAAAVGDEEDDDSELLVEDVGVDVTGTYAGPIGNLMHLVAVVHMDQEDLDQARYHLSRAICIRKEVFGARSGEYAESLHLMGTFWTKMERSVSALKCFQRALRVREQACGHMHESIATTCTELGRVLAEVGQPHEASLYLLRAIGIREQLFGPNDEVVLRLKETCCNLEAEGMHYDPVAGGEALPHFSQRTAESHLHGYGASAVGSVKNPTATGRSTTEKSSNANETPRGDPRGDDASARTGAASTRTAAVRPS